METPTPLITIAVTCYNALETIKSAVESAQNQDWPNFEIVIVDDKSTDGSLNVIEAMAKQDKRVRVIEHEQNMGVGAARNTLLRNARGEFIAFFDDDDTSQPGRLRTQYERITAYERATLTDLVVCYAARQQIIAGDQRRYQATLGMDITPGPPPERVAELILLGRPTLQGSGACATCSLMARKSVLERVNGFNPLLRRGEDTDLNIRLALTGAHFAGLSEPLVLQRLTDTEDKQLDEERRNQLQRIELHKQTLIELGWHGFMSAWTKLKFDIIQRRWIAAGLETLGLMIKHPMKLAARLLWVVQTNLRNKKTLAKI